MKAILLMLGALSAAIIFVGCGTAVGRATGVETSEVEQVIDANERAEYVEKTCKTQLITAINKQQSGFTTKDSILSDADANAFMEECLERIEAELATEGETGTDVEKAVEEAKQEVEIVKAGAEQVLAEREIMEAAQARCRRDSFNPNNLRGKSRGAFLAECLMEATANSGDSGDIDSDVEKAVEAAEQEIEIVKAGAEEVLAKRDLIALAQARCQQDFYDPSKRKGKPHHVFMNECMRDASGDIDELIDTDIEKAVEAAEQQMAVAKAEADRAEEEREIREAATRLCRHDSLNPSKRKGKSRNDFMNECLREAAANRDASDDIDTDIEKEVDIAEQELEIVKAGAEDVFEERVASLEEKVAELTELLEALQTQ